MLPKKENSFSGYQTSFVHFPLLFLFLILFFFFWPPLGVWCSQARAQIQTVVLIYAAAVAALDPLTLCAGQGVGIEPESWCIRDILLHDR